MNIKKISTDFFFHWYHQPSRNTSEGWDIWWEANKHKYNLPDYGETLYATERGSVIGSKTGRVVAVFDQGDEARGFVEFINEN